MRIFLFRGLLGDAFSTGMDALAEKLKSDGHTVSVHRWIEDNNVQARAIAEVASGAIRGRIATIGHSLGGNAASFAAHGLLKAGIDVAYVATVDATAPKPAPGGQTVSDNFRSRDWRDKPVHGATEFSFPNLSHIEIDKDEQVHSRIRAQIGALAAPASGQTGDTQMASINISGDASGNTRASGISEIAGGAGATGSEGLAPALATILAAVLAGRQDGAGTSDALAASVLRAESGGGAAGAPATQPQSLTPVNAALGQGVGKLLNGRKTGLGILGLLGTFVLPVLFPQLAPFQTIFKTLGATSPELIGGVVNGEAVETGKNLLVPIFTALSGWGILGKFEKWAEGMKRK